MSRVYATREDDGRRVLVELRCDHHGCHASIKPNPDIASSGWTKRGFSCGPNPDGFVEYDGCPEHQP